MLIIKEVVPREIANYKELEQNKNTNASKIVHKLSTTLQLFGMKEESKLAILYEEKILTNSWDLKPDFEKVLKKLSECIIFFRIK